MWLYNDSDVDVTVKINGIVSVTVMAKSYACFGNIKWTIDGSLINGVWNIVRADATNGGYTLNELTMVATSADGSVVDVYVGGFQTSKGAYGA